MALSFRPWRNPLCRHYSQCLAPAAKRNWLLSCHQCAMQRDLCFTSDNIGEKALLLRLFYPNLYRALNGGNQHGWDSVFEKIHDVMAEGRRIVVYKRAN